MKVNGSTGENGVPCLLIIEFVSMLTLTTVVSNIYVAT